MKLVLTCKPLSLIGCARCPSWYWVYYPYQNQVLNFSQPQGPTMYPIASQFRLCFCTLQEVTPPQHASIKIIAFVLQIKVFAVDFFKLLSSSPVYTLLRPDKKKCPSPTCLTFEIWLLSTDHGRSTSRGSRAKWLTQAVVARPSRSPKSLVSLFSWWAAPQCMWYSPINFAKWRTVIFLYHDYDHAAHSGPDSLFKNHFGL